MVPRPQYTAGEPCAAERRTEGTTTLASCRWRQCFRRWVSGGVVEWRCEVPEPKKVETVGRRCLLAVANEFKASKGSFNPSGDGQEAPPSNIFDFLGLWDLKPPLNHSTRDPPQAIPAGQSWAELLFALGRCSVAGGVPRPPSRHAREHIPEAERAR